MADTLGLGWAYGLQNFENLLAQRYAQARQKALDAEQIRQFNVGAAERSRQHDLEAQRYAASQAEMQRQHDAERARNIVTEAVPNDRADEPTQALLNRFGYGGAIRTITQDPYEGVDESRMGGPAVSKTGFLRGGSKYLTAEANRLNQAQIAQARADAAAREAADKRQFQEGQNALYKITAAQQGAIQAGNQDIKRMLAESTIGARNDKAAAAQKEDERKQAGAADEANTVINLADQLEQHPGFERIFGVMGKFPNFPGGEAANAKARLDQLMGQLSIEKIMEMKAQSRTGATGFGALSEKELNVLQNAAGRLSQAQSAEEARAALNEIRTRMRKVAGGGKAASNDQGAKPSADELIRKYRR